MTELTDATDQQSSTKTPKHAEVIRAAAKHLTKFAAAHGGPHYTFVEYVSPTFTRIVVVAQDGRYGDQVLPTKEAADAVVEATGFEISPEWDRESTGAVKTSGYEWGRMGRGRPA